MFCFVFVLEGQSDVLEQAWPLEFIYSLINLINDY